MSTDSERTRAFKKGLDPNAIKRGQQESRVSIRRQKREETLTKMRRVDGEEEQEQVNNDPFANVTFTLDDLPKLQQLILHGNPDEQLNGTVGVRKLLSMIINPPINEVIAIGLVPILINMLTSSSSKLQFEACWALTNIASGNSEQTRILLQHGAVPAFTRLLTSFDISVRDQAVWALGNIAGDSPQCRDYVLEQEGIIDNLRALTEPHIKSSVRRNAVWTLSNLCRGKNTPPSLEIIRPLLPLFSSLLESNDPKITIDTLWAISYVSDIDGDRINAIIDCGNLLHKVVELTSHNNQAVQSPALRIVGNIVTGTDAQTQAAIHCGLLPRLKYLLENCKKSMKKEVCWTISNITAGTNSQLDAVIDTGIIPILVDLLTNADFDTKKEAAWAIANATSNKLMPQIEHLVQNGAIKPICDLLFCPDPRIIAVSLEALENILVCGKAFSPNPFVSKIEEAGGCEKIEQLQVHPNKVIFKKASSLIDEFFEAQDEEDDTNDGVPVSNNSSRMGGFSF